MPARAELADDAAAEADGDRVGAGACLQLREQVADVRLHRLLREEEAVTDLAVHEAVRDQLEDLDLARGRVLVGALAAGAWNGMTSATVVGPAACRDLFEASACGPGSG